ncbi:MAG: site-specific DNA-methyltransferase [Actinobacteria bacterium]|nr:site-specific DNA-methyltransferase [Actinomycetota bacterium]
MTRTSAFGVGKREGHDSSPYYERGIAQARTRVDREPVESPVFDELFCQSSTDMNQLPDDSVALMVTSPPYHVGKDYDSEGSFEDYLELLRTVFEETYRVLEPGGRAVVNVANLGRRPYVSLAQQIGSIMETVGYLPRGEVIWVKGRGASGSCAWGSWRSASNPTLRDLHEYCLCFSKERWDRAKKGVSTISREEFMEATLSIWEIQAESAARVKHPAPFPVALPRRFIELYTFVDDLVLDPFLGSGSTAVAAVESGRRYVGYDISEEYVITARERVEKAAADKASAPVESAAV